MHQQEIDFGVDRDPRTGLKDDTNNIHTIDEELVLEDEVRDYRKVKVLRKEAGGGSRKNKKHELTLRDLARSTR